MRACVYYIFDIFVPIFYAYYVLYIKINIFFTIAELCVYPTSMVSIIITVY